MRLHVIAIVLMLLIFGCTSQQQPAPPAPASSALVAGAVTDASDSGQVGDAAASNGGQESNTAASKIIDIVAGNWEFEPSTITLKKGEKVVLRIRSADVAHGFAVDELGLNVNIPAGQTVEVEFTPDKAGTFTSYCSVFCGFDASIGKGHESMKGTIIVEE